jgi:hypothetical protein
MFASLVINELPQKWTGSNGHTNVITIYRSRAENNLLQTPAATIFRVSDSPHQHFVFMRLVGVSK